MVKEMKELVYSTDLNNILIRSLRLKNAAFQDAQYKHKICSINHPFRN